MILVDRMRSMFIDISTEIRHNESKNTDCGDILHCAETRVLF